MAQNCYGSASLQASLLKQPEIASSNIPPKTIFHVVDVFILFCEKRSHLPSCAIVSFVGDYCDKYRNSSSHLPAKEAETDEMCHCQWPAHQTLVLYHVMHHWNVYPLELVVSFLPAPETLFGHVYLFKQNDILFTRCGFVKEIMLSQVQLSKENEFRYNVIHKTYLVYLWFWFFG